MRNELNIRNIETTQLEKLLENENYRYERALKDGAVNTVIKEIINRINDLEGELERRLAHPANNA